MHPFGGFCIVTVCGQKDGRRPFVCPSSTLEDLRCLDLSQLCDGISDCAENEDEEMAACVLFRRVSVIIII